MSHFTLNLVWSSRCAIAPTALAAVFLTPRQLVSWSVSCLGLGLSPDCCLSAGKCCSLFHSLARGSCSEMATQGSAVWGLQLPPRPPRTQVGSEWTSLSSLKIFSDSECTLRPGNPAWQWLYYWRTQHYSAWASFGHSEDCPPSLLSIPFLTQPQTHTSGSFHPPAYLFTLLPSSRLYPTAGPARRLWPRWGSGRSPSALAPWPAWWLNHESSLCTTTSRFFAVHSLTSLIYFFIIPLWHTIEI